jgi:hypothetical protein
MRFEYEPTLVERAVRMAVQADATLAAALHAEIDPIYRLDDLERRDRAFADAFSRCFQALDLGRPPARLIAAFPLLAANIDVCRIRTAPRRADERAELFVRREEDAGHAARTLLILLCAESLVDFASTEPMLRRELLHVCDMIDPAFGYDAKELARLPRLDQPVRDRYRVLWDIYVESRLLKDQRVPAGGAEQLAAAFIRAFTLQGQAPPQRWFDLAFTVEGLRHDVMLSIARRPQEFESLLAGVDDARPPRVQTIATVESDERTVPAGPSPRQVPSDAAAVGSPLIAMPGGR